MIIITLLAYHSFLIDEKLNYNQHTTDHFVIKTGTNLAIRSNPTNIWTHYEPFLLTLYRTKQVQIKLEQKRKHSYLFTTGTNNTQIRLDK
jgi:hypothetical protein